MHNGLNALASRFHKDNQHWWTDPATGQRLDRNRREMLMLMNSEVCEAMEGERKNLMDDHLPTRRMAEVEMADVIIRLFDYIGGLRYDVDVSLEKAFPRLRETQFNIPSLTEHFRWGIFNKRGNRASQLLTLTACIVRIAELEDAGEPAWRIADAITMLIVNVCAYCGAHEYNLWDAITEKHAYNAQRADHKNEARLAAGGKAW